MLTVISYRLSHQIRTVSATTRVTKILSRTCLTAETFSHQSSRDLRTESVDAKNGSGSDLKKSVPLHSAKKTLDRRSDPIKVGMADDSTSQKNVVPAVVKIPRGVRVTLLRYRKCGLSYPVVDSLHDGTIRNLPRKGIQVHLRPYRKPKSTVIEDKIVSEPHSVPKSVSKPTVPIAMALTNNKLVVNNEKTDVKKKKTENKNKKPTKEKKNVAVTTEVKGQMVIFDKLVIADGSTGYSFEAVFGRCLDDSLTEVWLDEPYLNIYPQLNNLTHFCELLVAKSKSLTHIWVTTKGTKRGSNIKYFDFLKKDLKKRNIELIIHFNPKLHDRQARFSNGWVAKSGYGLHFHNRWSSRLVLGFHDTSLLPCRQNIVDYYFTK